LKRGEVWTVSGGADYAGKARPAVIVQDDRYADTVSITICLFTTNTTDAPLIRVVVEPSSENGLNAHSRVMADKIMTVPRTKIGRRIGRLAREDMLRLDRAMLVFLGLAG
jgi:mRNA interferase MazF